MYIKCAFMAVLICLSTTITLSQATLINLKVGNNGTLSLNNKFYSGNYNELQQFGRGYNCGIEIQQNFTKNIGVKLEGNYVHSNAEIDHNSFWKSEMGSKKLFYEEISVNNSTLNLSSSAFLKLGPVRLGVGPELAMIFNSVGWGSRFFFSDSLNTNVTIPVQYNFFSKRKQVYNRNNPDELHSYDISRFIYGMNFNLAFTVYKPFSIEIKTFFPMNDFIADFLSFHNNSINQKSIITQVSVMYSFPVSWKKVQKKKRRTMKKRGKVKPRYLKD